MTADRYKGILGEQALLSHEIFAQNIKEARLARGWSQDETAKRCLLSRNAYRAVEEGALGTAIGAYWAVLDTLELTEGISDLAAPHRDHTGRANKKVTRR